MKKLLIFLLILFSFGSVIAQAPFSKGVNLTGWLQASSPKKIQFRKFSKTDFENIKNLGCDVIRLPVNLHAMTDSTSAYIIDPLLFSFLDSAVNWAESLQLYLIIDNHSFDPVLPTSPQIGEILVKVWPQIAQRYKERSNYILYEVLNEPHGLTNSVWGEIQRQAIASIRAVDAKHTIVVGPSGYNSYNDLAQMPYYSDTNLLYTFHFYDPFVFTHQGADWGTPSLASLAGVPFPYNAITMPACPADLLGTWVEQALSQYPSQGNVNYVHSLINIAENFRTSRNVNIFCGEFGVLMHNSDTAHRAYWYGEVKNYLESKNIPWTTWDYKGSFGLFEKGSYELFESDLNIPLLQALGLNVPPQKPYLLQPDTAGVIMYDDFIEKGIINESYQENILDFYSTLLPNNGSYCMYWSDYQQYNAISFNFSPDRDFSQLINKNFALDMIVRGNVSGIKFDARFVDTKTNAPDDHPWRMRTTFADHNPDWDKRWHHIHIPLTEFTEQGSWDNGTWFNPEGKFDWKAVDRFEIVAEYSAMQNKDVWFDNIMLTDLDTATVLQTGTLGIDEQKPYFNHIQLAAIPNPMRGQTNITYCLTENTFVNLSLFDLNGQLVSTLVKSYQNKGMFSISWNGTNQSGQIVPPGIYICKLVTSDGNSMTKIMVL